MPGSPPGRHGVRRTAVPRSRFGDAHIYRFDPYGAGDDRVLQAQDMTVDPDDQPATSPDEDAVTQSSRRLLASDAPASVAEMQWRWSTGVSTLLLGLLGIPMSRVRPRQARVTRFGTAILIYVAYYMLFTSARTWVQHGAVPAFPGRLVGAGHARHACPREPNRARPPFR